MPTGMLSRRRVITILGAAAGLPLLPAADTPKDTANLYRWRGTALGSPSTILLHHPDRGAAEQALAQCVAEIERLEGRSACTAATARSHASIATGVWRPHPMICWRCFRNVSASTN